MKVLQSTGHSNGKSSRPGISTQQTFNVLLEQQADVQEQHSSTFLPFSRLTKYWPSGQSRRIYLSFHTNRRTTSVAALWNNTIPDICCSYFYNPDKQHNEERLYSPNESPSNRIAIIKPSSSHAENTAVCCGGSSTMWKITAHLPTVSLADEWQRQEKLILSQLCDALNQECICGSYEEAEEWRVQVVGWDSAGVDHYYHPEICWGASGPPIMYSNTCFMGHPISSVAEIPGDALGEQSSSTVGVCWAQQRW